MPCSCLCLKTLWLIMVQLVKVNWLCNYSFISHFFQFTKALAFFFIILLLLSQLWYSFFLLILKLCFLSFPYWLRISLYFDYQSFVNFIKCKHISISSSFILLMILFDKQIHLIHHSFLLYGLYFICIMLKNISYSKIKRYFHLYAFSLLKINFSV